MLNPLLMGRTQAGLNIAGGVWPLVHQRSFEAVFGPKADRWLVYTVAGLLTSIGCVQAKLSNADEWSQARSLGVGTAATLLTIDLVYVPRGTLKWTYLIDAAAEAAMLGGWAMTSLNHSKRRS